MKAFEQTINAVVFDAEVSITGHDQDKRIPYNEYAIKPEGLYCLIGPGRVMFFPMHRIKRIELVTAS